MNASVSRKSSAITPRGGSASVGVSRNSSPMSTKLETTTALTIDSKSAWSTNRHSFEYRPKAANSASLTGTTKAMVPASRSS